MPRAVRDLVKTAGGRRRSCRPHRNPNAAEQRHRSTTPTMGDQEIYFRSEKDRANWFTCTGGAAEGFRWDREFPGSRLSDS
jgi:hypothetical protein